MSKFIETEEKISKSELNEFINEYKLNLPKDYCEHILKHNGGAPVAEFFNSLQISYFYAIKYGEEDETLESTIDMIQDVLPKNYFPFAYDGGGNQFCISLNDNNFGKIYYCPMDMGDIEPEFLINSFTEFLDNLSEDDDY